MAARGPDLPGAELWESVMLLEIAGVLNQPQLDKLHRFDAQGLRIE